MQKKRSEIKRWNETFIAIKTWDKRFQKKPIKKRHILITFMSLLSTSYREITENKSLCEE